MLKIVPPHNQEVSRPAKMTRLPRITVSTALCVLCLLVALLGHHSAEGSPVDLASYYQDANGRQGYYQREIQREYQPKPWRTMQTKNTYPEAPNERSVHELAEMKTRYAALFFK